MMRVLSTCWHQRRLDVIDNIFIPLISIPLITFFYRISLSISRKGIIELNNKEIVFSFLSTTETIKKGTLRAVVVALVTLKERP